MSHEYDTVSKMLHEGMHEGEMHTCLRDAGRLAGGYYASRALSPADMSALEALAISLSKTKSIGLEKWREAVQFGSREPIDQSDNQAFDWNETVEITSSRRKHIDAPPPPVVDQLWVQAEDIPEPAADCEPGDMIRYLEAMYEPEECVRIVRQAYMPEGSDRWLPHKGFWDIPRADLVAELQKYSSDIGKAIGDGHPEAGAWVCINPLDGQGVKDANVTAFRHSLIEADDQDLGKQLALIKALRLPCTCIVHSGGKSIHALVKVDAASAEEYRTRVDRLYAVCAESGLRVDGANRNPSRLSRLPGVERRGRLQYIIAQATGEPSWAAWEKFIDESHDDLPDPEALTATFFNPPPLAPELIAGILREGDKMRLTGPSKAGKSFGLIGLTVAIAEGLTWMGARVKQGRVLYINLELNRSSAIHRFRSVYQAQGIDCPDGLQNIDIWNLRGHAVPLDKLAPKLIRRAEGKAYRAVIVDPIYKLQWGDENDAGDVARFCNQLDNICKTLGCAIIDAHHHSKGAQGQKRSIDRGSGSGVFGRDPDAILDMIELSISEKRREQIADHLEIEALDTLGVLHGLDMTQIPDDARAPSSAYLIEFQRAFPALKCDASNAVYAAGQAALCLSGWRVESTLREFGSGKPYLCWFRYPCHVPDRWDLLKDAKAEGEEAPWKAQQNDKESAIKAKQDAKREAFNEAVKACNGVGVATAKQVADSLGVTVRAIQQRIAKDKTLTLVEGVICFAK
jgi:regulatory protein RepA